MVGAAKCLATLVRSRVPPGQGRRAVELAQGCKDGGFICREMRTSDGRGCHLALKGLCFLEDFGRVRLPTRGDKAFRSSFGATM